MTGSTIKTIQRNLDGVGLTTNIVIDGKNSYSTVEAECVHRGVVYNCRYSKEYISRFDSRLDELSNILWILDAPNANVVIHCDKAFISVRYINSAFGKDKSLLLVLEEVKSPETIKAEKISSVFDTLMKPHAALPVAEHEIHSAAARYAIGRFNENLRDVDAIANEMKHLTIILLDYEKNKHIAHVEQSDSKNIEEKKLAAIAAQYGDTYKLPPIRRYARSIGVPSSVTRKGELVMEIAKRLGKFVPIEVTIA